VLLQQDIKMNENTPKEKEERKKHRNKERKVRTDYI